MSTRLWHDGIEIEICAEANAYMNNLIMTQKMTPEQLKVEEGLRTYDKQKVVALDARKYGEVCKLRHHLCTLKKGDPQLPIVSQQLRMTQEAYRRINRRMNFLTDLCVLLSLWTSTASSSSASATVPPPSCTSKIPPDFPSFQLDPPTPPLPRSLPHVDSPELLSQDLPRTPPRCAECENAPCDCEDLTKKEPNSADEDSRSEDGEYVPSN